MIYLCASCQNIKVSRAGGICDKCFKYINHKLGQINKVTDENKRTLNKALRLLIKFETATRLHEMVGSLRPEERDGVEQYFKDTKKQLKEFLRERLG